MGHAFEPDTAAYLERFASQPPRENQTLDDLRADYRANLLADSIAPDGSVATEDILIERPTGDPMSGRLYTPVPETAAAPLLIYVHGGGFAVGDIASHDRLAHLIAQSADVRVLLFEYGRAPENPFPTGRDDTVTAFHWALRHADKLGFDSTRIALGGESAGTAHAVAAALVLKETLENRPAALWLMSPALDATSSGESYTTYATGAGRTAVEFGYLWSLYAPDETSRAAPDVSPLFADLAGLPPIYAYPAEFDPARSDGERFAEKAKQAGVSVSIKLRTGLIHQYPEMTGVSAQAKQAVVDASRDLAAALG